MSKYSNDAEYVSIDRAVLDDMVAAVLRVMEAQLVPEEILHASCEQEVLQRIHEDSASKAKLQKACKLMMRCIWASDHEACSQERNGK